MAKRIMALLLCLTMMISLTQSVFASSNSFGDLETIDATEEKNMQDVEFDSNTEVTLIGTEIGEGYTISSYSVNWTVEADTTSTGEKQYVLATGDYIHVDFTFSPTPTDGIQVGGYNRTNGYYYSTTNTSSSMSTNLKFSVAGTYSLRIKNSSSVDITVSGTYSVINFESSASLDVPYHYQEQSNWCWATCIQMCAEFLGYPRTQTEIVTAVKGSAINEGGKTVDYLNGMLFATDDVYRADRIIDTISASEIRSILESGLPLIIGLKISTTYHGVVVKAISSDNSYIKTNNPTKKSDGSENIKIYKYSTITTSGADYEYYTTTQISLNS